MDSREAALKRMGKVKEAARTLAKDCIEGKEMVLADDAQDFLGMLASI